MRMKLLSFEEYALAKIGNEDKRYGEIFDIAWKNTAEADNRRKSFERLTSGLINVYIIGKAPVTIALIMNAFS